MADREIDDVAIVGCGPVGAVMANLLGQAGLQTTVYEIGSSVYHLPRAAHFDAEIMRVFQAIGLAEAVLPATRPVKGMHFLNAAGDKLFGFDAPDGTGPQGWPSGFLFYQPDLEVALRDGLARHPSLGVQYEHEVIAIDQDADAVAIRVRDLRSGEERTDHARYVIGTDGGRSTVRKLAGLELEDLGFDQPWLVVDTMLKRDVALPDVALQICDPARPATFIPSSGRHRRWELMLMAGDTPESMERPERVEELIRPWISTDDTEIIRAVVYTFHALIAKHWRDRRVLLAGDAAHQMPPFLGQGMCSGIRDAHNLAWKLRMVLAGAADDSLLDTYQQERAPHVRAIIERAVGLGRIIQTTDPAIAAARDAHFAAGGALPEDDAASPGEASSQNRMPGLASGVLSSSPQSGALFPQPFVQTADGRESRLDDILGDGFAVIGGAVSDAALARAAAEIAGATTLPVVAVRADAALAPTPGMAVVADRSGILRRWIAQHGTTIVRSDRYVYGTARDDAGLAELTRSLIVATVK